MISDVLESIAGLEVFPIIGLILFVLVFLAVVIWVFKLPKRSVNRWSRIPLDDDNVSDSKGAKDNE